ncbi:hypothetical protein ABIA19_002439 [Sinorhizobium fredii]
MPQRAVLRLGRARRAGGIDGLVQNEFFAVAPFAAFGREPGKVGRLDSQRGDETVAEIIGDIHFVGIDDVAAWLDQLDFPGRKDATALLIVVDPAGHHFVAAIFDLHVAAHGDDFRVAVVDQLVGGQQEFRVSRNARLQLIDSGRGVLRHGRRVHSDGKHMQRHARKKGGVGKLHRSAVACRH